VSTSIDTVDPFTPTVAMKWPSDQRRAHRTLATGRLVDADDRPRRRELACDTVGNLADGIAVAVAGKEDETDRDPGDEITDGARGAAAVGPEEARDDEQEERHASCHRGELLWVQVEDALGVPDGEGDPGDAEQEQRDPDAHLLLPVLSAGVRKGSSAMIRRRALAPSSIQREISSRVRRHPTHRPVACSMTQTFMQGVSMRAVSIARFGTRLPWRRQRPSRPVNLGMSDHSCNRMAK
jgi:hypothetical protein